MIERCFWTETTTRFVPPAADLPARTAVAVIGGGYTGVAAARALARAGRDVTLLEREELGSGASTRNGGFVLAGFKPGARELLDRFGAARARQLFDLSLESIRSLERTIREDAIACDYRRSGHLTVAARPSHLEDLRREHATLAERFSHETRILSADELRAEIGSARFPGALLDPFAGVVHPARLFAGLAAGAARSGARMLERLEVRRVRGRRGDWRVETSRGTLLAEELFLATNGYLGREHAGLRRRVLPIGSYVIATPPLDPSLVARLIPHGRVVNDTRNHLVYFRFSPDGRMIFGGRASFVPTSALDAARILTREMGETFPELAGTSPEYCWSGRVGFTRDQLPHAGTLAGAHFAAGYCGHGVAMSTFLGDAMGRAIAGSAEPPPLAELGFPAIPLFGGTPWFLPLVGAWYRLMDRLH